MRKENSYSVGTHKNEVITAHDPNIKYGPEGNVSPGEKLTYKVEYENEGEGSAFGVYFTDTLDEDLDDSTLEIRSVKSTKDGSIIASAGKYNSQTRTITWFMGEVGSKEGGYAEISVNAKSNLSEGTEIINYATVYFPSVPETTRTNAIVSIIGSTDTTVPTTTTSASPSANDAGWNNSDVTVTLTAEDTTDGSGVKEIHYKINNGDEKVVTGSTAEVSLTEESAITLNYWAVDNDGNTETQNSLEVKIDKTAPTITLSASPSTLWPPNKKMVDVTVKGSAKDELSGIISTTFTITDEYGSVSPTISGFGSAIQLEAWRNGNDSNGRLYTITATSEDSAGNQSSASTEVICPHDQGKK